MNFSLTDEHVALQDAVHRFCEGEYPAQHRGNPESVELAAQRWSAMAELGLIGLTLDLEYGGSGQTAVEVMLAAQELGHCLGGAAWLASVLPAAQLLSDAGTPGQRSRWLPLVASGQKKLAFAHGEADSRYCLSRVSTQASECGNGWRINGRKTLVLDGVDADAFVVVARTAGEVTDAHGLALFVVDAKTSGVSIQGFPTLDGRRAAHVSFSDVLVDKDAVIGTAGDALALIEAAVDRATAALCAEATGALDALIELTAEHLKTRQQFGVPLAKFQVLQHRMADMLIALEQSKSMACAAAMAVDDGAPGERRRLVSAAKVIVGQAGRFVSQWAIQMHGAMGMTDECRVGHYAKRLLVINQLFGDASHHLLRFAHQPPVTTGHDLGRGDV